LHIQGIAPFYDFNLEYISVYQNYGLKLEFVFIQNCGIDNYDMLDKFLNHFKNIGLKYGC